MNTYKEHCLKLSQLFNEASETGQPIQLLSSNGTYLDNPFGVDMDSDLYRIKPVHKPNKDELEKYIQLKLDMEFTNHADFNTDAFLIIGKLTSIEMGSNSGLPYYVVDGVCSKYRCRLRANHIHWWNRFAINPIPKNAKFRLFNQVREWSPWYSSDQSRHYVFDGHSDHTILAFEVKYGDNLCIIS